MAAAAGLGVLESCHVSYRGASGPQMPPEGHSRGGCHALRPLQPKEIMSELALVSEFGICVPETAKNGK